jgi:hypothetical protein
MMPRRMAVTYVVFVFVAVLMTVMMIMMMLGSGLQVDFGRGPAKDALQPAAEQGDRHDQAHRPQLPPEVGYDYDCQTIALARREPRPGQCRDKYQQQDGRPGAGSQCRPHLLPVDAAQAPGHECEQ